MSGPIPEPQVVVPTSRRLWIALLAGPSLWFGHFMAVYLLAEAACAADALTTGSWGITALAWLVVGVTILALAVLGLAARRTWTYRRDHADQALVLAVAMGLDVLFATAILFTAVPAVVLVPC